MVGRKKAAERLPGLCYWSAHSSIDFTSRPTSTEFLRHRSVSELATCIDGVRTMDGGIWRIWLRSRLELGTTD